MARVRKNLQSWPSCMATQIVAKFESPMHNDQYLGPEFLCTPFRLHIFCYLTSSIESIIPSLPPPPSSTDVTTSMSSSALTLSPDAKSFGPGATHVAPIEHVVRMTGWQLTEFSVTKLFRFGTSATQYVSKLQPIECEKQWQYVLLYTLSVNWQMCIGYKYSADK